MKLRFKDFFLISVLVILSVFIHGYYFGVIDHHHYLPYLNKLLDPGLYPNDYYFSQPHGLYSPFNYLLTGFTQLLRTNLAITHLVFYLFSLLLLYLSIYQLSRAIYKQKLIGFLAILLFMLPKWAAQIGYMTHHFYFVSRDLSLALSLLALTGILLKRYRPSAIYLALAVFVNPSIPVPVAIFWLLSVVKFSFPRFHLFMVASPWIETLKQRGTYSFPHLWHWTGWGNLILWLSLFTPGYLVFKQKIFAKHYQPLLRFLFICVILFIGHSLMALFFPSPWLIQIQLLRSLNFIFVLAILSFATAIKHLLDFGPLWIKLISLLSLAGVFWWGDHLTIGHFLAIWLLPICLLLFKPTLTSSRHSHLTLYLALLLLLTQTLHKLVVVKPQINLPYYWHYPNTLINIANFDPWLQLQQWALAHTPVEAVFLVPPSLEGFRSFSQRGIVGDAKDGGVTFYSSQYATVWEAKMSALNDYNQFSLQDFNNLKRQYPFDYLVVYQKHLPLSLPVVFQNEKFLVYKI